MTLKSYHIDSLLLDIESGWQYQLILRPMIILRLHNNTFVYYKIRTDKST